MADMSGLQVKLQKGASAIQSNSYVSAITNGLMSLMPVTIVGALGSLINSLPFAGYQTFLVNTGLKTVTAIPTEITTNLLALYAVFLIAAKFAEAHDIDGIPAGMLSLMTFFIVTPFVTPEGAYSIQAYSTYWFGAQGLFTAFIVALVVAKIYTVFTVKGWVIKMPAGVPPTVSKSFSSMIPGFVVAIGGLVIRYGLSLTPFEDLHQMIFGLVATPLQALGGSFPALIVAVLACHILWLCGVHGGLVTYSVFIAIWTPLGTANLAAYNAGQPIPNIITGSLFAMTIVTGSGSTLGLAISMLRAKSAQYRMLGKLALVPNAVGINEPLIFGLPIIMNFTLAIPFILVPLTILFAGYFGMLSGILPYLPGISVPLGVPVIVNGLMAGGWRWAIFQALSVVLSYFVYRPFFKKIDQQAFELEEAAKTETTATTTTTAAATA